MRRLLPALAGALLVLLLPVIALAHPLGNFTINHYAGIRVEPDRVLLDIVIDQAEIPAFQARQELDVDEDGEVSDRELDRGRVASCTALAPDLHVVADGAALEPRLMEAGLEMRPGVGGLSTLRLVCAFEALLAATIGQPTRIEFTDASNADRLGWREIVVEGSGVTINVIEGDLRSTSASARLTDYPTSLLDAALLDERVVIEASTGGGTLAAFDVPDAAPVDAGLAGPGTPSGPAASPVPAAIVPGGVAGEVPALFQTSDLTPVVLLASLLVAAALGAGHALTPGHGKTLMAAYLVGTRGTPVHAIGLGMSVSVSHTLGILVLAFIVVGAQGVLSPDVVVRVAPVVAAITIVAIGLWMLASELRRRAASRSAARAHEHLHDAGHDHAHTHGHEHGHEHGGVSHSHLPAAGSTITWRSLFVLGLAGGIIPSTNALLILLGTIAAGRPAFGLVLVVAFGLGMAAVMAGVGLVMILARGRLDAFRIDSPVGRLRAWVPLGAAVVVLGLGVVLSVQALTGPASL